MVSHLWNPFPTSCSKLGINYIVGFLTMLCSMLTLHITQWDAQASEYLMVQVMISVN